MIELRNCLTEIIIIAFVAFWAFREIVPREKDLDSEEYYEDFARIFLLEN